MSKRIILFLYLALSLIFIIVSTSIAGSIELPQTGQTKCFDLAGNEIACPGTGQDGEIRAGVEWPDPRFADNGDGTITDRLTGLIWLKDGNCFGPQTWYSSLDNIVDFNIHPGNYSCQDYTAAYTDWRLPNVNELESLLNPEQEFPSTWLNDQGFKNVQHNWYWSSTTRAATVGLGPAMDSAWTMSMMVGWINSLWKGNSETYLLPVRAGQSCSTDPNFPANVWKTGQKTSYYPGDDGDIQAGVSWPSERFTDNGDMIVTDNLTGLMWTINGGTPVVDTCPAETMTWQDASDFVACLNANNYLGYEDWRLANRKELFSLIDYSQDYPALPVGHPFVNLTTDPSSQYWASTSVGAYSNAVAWLAGIKNEGGIGGDWKNNQSNYNYQVWPVRDPIETLFTLTLDLDPPDSGTVSGPGINCGSDCEETYDQGTEVTLTAEAEPGWEFAYWDDGEACYTYEILTVLMDKSKTITALFSISPEIDSIGGINDGSGVVNGKWTGQPDWAPKKASNGYLDYYAIESQNNNYYWEIYGSGFGDDPGEIYFSNSQITYELQRWSDSLIVIVPKTPYTFEYDTNVVLEIVNSYGLSDTINIPVVGLIQSRGFGQCTWFVASTLLAQDKTIPPKAYSTNGTIDGSYEPEQWDALTSGDEHVAIITSGIDKKEQTKGKNTVITYTFTVEEMNARWDELPSSMDGSLVIKIGRNGYEHIMKNRMSDTKMKATGYFRTE